MFDWVTGTLFDQVYEPLKEFAGEIATVINPYNEDWGEVDEDYRKDILLFSTAKFLHYAFKNREKVGGDKFFTQHDLSNEYLRKLFENICMELKQIFDKPVVDDGNINEGVTINIQFLAIHGNAKDYSTFKTLITGCFFPYNLQVESNRGDKFIDFWSDELEVVEKIKLLKRCYPEKGYLPGDSSVIYSDFSDMLGGIFDVNDPEKRWQRDKIYVYFVLFHKLFSYELHRMYNSWYIGYKDKVDLSELFYVIDKVFEITESKEEAARKFLAINSREEYEELFVRYRGLCEEEKVEIGTTQAIIADFGQGNPKILNDVKKTRADVLEKIRDKKKEIEKYGFIASEEEMSSFEHISLEGDKLFELGLNTSPIRICVYFKKIMKITKLFSCLLVIPTTFILIILHYLLPQILDIIQAKSLTFPLIVYTSLVIYFVIFILSSISIPLDYMFSKIEVDFRILANKFKRAIFIGSCISATALLLLLVCIILQSRYGFDFTTFMGSLKDLV